MTLWDKGWLLLGTSLPLLLLGLMGIWEFVTALRRREVHWWHGFNQFWAQSDELIYWFITATYAVGGLACVIGAFWVGNMVLRHQ